MTDTTTPDVDLDAIRARLDAATPGPWTIRDGWKTGPGGRLLFARIAGGADETVLDEPYTGSDLAASPADAELITHARQDIPALLAEVERLRAVQGCGGTGSPLVGGALFLAAIRWAQANGWSLSGAWINAATWQDATVTVDWDPPADRNHRGYAELIVSRRDTPEGDWTTRTFQVDSVREAVDVLCAVRVLPPHLASTAAADTTAPLPGAVPITQAERAELLAGALGLAQRARAEAEAERDRLRAELEQARTTIVELAGLVDEPPAGSHVWDRDGDGWERRAGGLWCLVGYDEAPGWGWQTLRQIHGPLTADNPAAGQVTP